MSRFNLKKEEKSKEQIAEKIAFSNKLLVVLEEKSKKAIKTVSILEKQIKSLDEESSTKKIKLESEIHSLEKEVVVLKKDLNTITGKYSGTSRSLMEAEDKLTEYRRLLTQVEKEYKDGLSTKDLLVKKNTSIRKRVTFEIKGVWSHRRRCKTKR